VFVRSGTNWIQQAKLIAADGSANDQFGGAVAVSGDTAVIGAVNDSDAGSESGAAYVFVRSNTSWTSRPSSPPPTARPAITSAPRSRCPATRR